jgi:hypothetical protein
MRDLTLRQLITQRRLRDAFTLGEVPRFARDDEGAMEFMKWPLFLRLAGK